jgi:hypothetical protein
VGFVLQDWQKPEAEGNAIDQPVTPGFFTQIEDATGNKHVGSQGMTFPPRGANELR